MGKAINITGERYGRLTVIKCDPRAYAKCPTRIFCGACAAEADYIEGSECDRFNQKVLSQPQTLADRIRAMTDEDMAVWIARMRYCITKDICKQLGVTIPANEEKLLRSSHNVLEALQATSAEV